MIKCRNCGGEVKFDPQTQKVKCNYCGESFDPNELKDEVKSVEEENRTDTYEGKAYKCSQCGATLMTFDDTAITFCSYCGSQAMLEDKMVQHNNPEFIIPFKKTKEECIAAYKKKLSKFLFVPYYMKSDVTVDRFRGIYMPYCIYNFKNKGKVLNKGSKYAYSRGDYNYYNDYQIEADIDASYDGVSYDLVSKYYDNFSTAIPFDSREAVKFNPSYMAGYYADSYDVSANVYNDEALSIVKSDASKKLNRRGEFSKYGCSSPSCSLTATSKVGMFPVYFLAVRDKNNQNVHYAVVNGQTGEVAADLPIDFSKYVVGALILAVIIYLLINSFIVLTPTKVSFFAVIMGIISFIISMKQIKKIDIRASHSDDKGVNGANVGNKKVASSIATKITDEIGKCILFAIMAFILGISVLMPLFLDSSPNSSLMSLNLVKLSIYMGICFAIRFIIKFAIKKKKQKNDGKRHQ